jgi:hypothetical protein
MTTKYIARLDGKIVGRRTTKARTYTHAIVVQRIEELARKDAYEYTATKEDRRSFDYYTAVAARTTETQVPHPAGFNYTSSASEIADAKQRIEGGFDAFIARKRADYIERFEAHKAKGGFEPQVAAWAGRLDLAQKAVGQHTHGGCRLVAIVPAEEAA